MLFNSTMFLLAFLPASLAVFFLAGARSPKTAAVLLALASLIFYGSWNYAYIPLLLVSITANFLLSQAIADRRRSDLTLRAIFAVAVAGNLALLGYFKYANFFLKTYTDLTHHDITAWAIVLPLGISFYTFTQIAYLVDTLRNEVRERDFAHYLLFVTYFPHLIAGPILHHAEMMPQFANRAIYRPRCDNFATGLSIFIMGLAKKTLLADAIAPVARAVFGAADVGIRVEFLRAWGGALAYAMQIYFDFSAYCDMAIGISILFGVRLPLNFNSPYKAASIIDFWRRWHMTLSRFLRDYLYIPLGGNRQSPVRRYMNLLITMLLGGLWHGAAWTYVVWGGLHGTYLIVNHAWRFLFARGRRAKPSHAISRIAGVGVTFVMVVVAWVVFRAASFKSALIILAGMAGRNGIAVPDHFTGLKSAVARQGWSAASNAPYVSNIAVLGLVALITLCWIMPNVYQMMGARSPALNGPEAVATRWQWHPSVAWAISLGVLGAFAIATMLSGPPSEFLYFQF